MKKVEFEYDLDQTVITPFGGIGIISMLGVDDGGKNYFVKTESGGSWFKESQLKPSDNP